VKLVPEPHYFPLNKCGPGTNFTLSCTGRPVIWAPRFMHDRQNCDAIRFGSIHQIEGETSYENSSRPKTLGLAGHGERECAAGSFFNRNSKLFGSIGLHTRVVLDFP